MRLVLPILLFTSFACAAGGSTDSGAQAAREGDDAGECADGADNDVDGEFDCDDADCVGSRDCDDSGADDTDSGGQDCKPPIISGLVVEAYSGLVSDEQGSHPAMAVSFDAADADGSLAGVVGSWWRDEVVDGEVRVSQDGEPLGPYPDADRYTVLIAVDGGTLDFETEYEFAIQLVDTTGCEGNHAIDAGTTPDSAGNP